MAGKQAYQLSWYGTYTVFFAGVAFKHFSQAYNCEISYFELLVIL